MRDGKPIISVPCDGEANSYVESTFLSEMAELDWGPKKRLDLRLVRIEQKYEQCLVELKNNDIELRELYALRKDRFDSICNSVFSSLLVSVGTYIASTQSIPFFDSLHGSMLQKLGWGIVIIGVILGIIKPPAQEILWKLLRKKPHALICPKCGKSIDKH